MRDSSLSSISDGSDVLRLLWGCPAPTHRAHRYRREAPARAALHPAQTPLSRGGTLRPGLHRPRHLGTGGAGGGGGRRGGLPRCSPSLSSLCRRRDMAGGGAGSGADRSGGPGSGAAGSGGPGSGAGRQPRRAGTPRAGQREARSFHRPLPARRTSASGTKGARRGACLPAALWCARRPGGLPGQWGRAVLAAGRRGRGWREDKTGRFPGVS